MINGQGSGNVHAHGATCTLPQTGRTTASQQGSKVIVSYYLPGALIETYVTTPVTCAPGHGTFLCPTDPKGSLTTDVELQFTVETPGAVCDAHVDPATVQVHNVTVDSQDLTADIAKDAVALWGDLTGTDYISMAENYVTQAVSGYNGHLSSDQQLLIGPVSTFTSGLCKTVVPLLPSASDIWQLTGSVDANQGVILQLLDQQPTPSLQPAVITPARPAVTAGNTVRIDGQFFPPNGGPVTLTWGGPNGAGALGTATLSGQGTFSTTVTIPASLAPGGYAIHAQSSSAKADVTVQVTAPGGQGTLTITGPGGLTYTGVNFDYSFALNGTNLTPGSLTIFIDSPTGPQLGTATVGGDGTFRQDFTITTGQTSPGSHTLVAVQSGTVQASLPMTVEVLEDVH